MLQPIPITLLDKILVRIRIPHEDPDYSQWSQYNGKGGSLRSLTCFADGKVKGSVALLPGGEEVRVPIIYLHPWSPDYGNESVVILHGPDKSCDKWRVVERIDNDFVLVRRGNLRMRYPIYLLTVVYG